MWAIYAILSAIFIATTDPVAKRALKASDEYVVGWLLLVFSLTFLGAYSFLNPAVRITPALLRMLAFAMPFEIIATVLYYKALKLTDISLSVPFLALTPVFAILTAFLLLGERIRPSVALGIGLVTIGAYSLNLREVKHGFVSPVKAIFLNKGSLYMVIVSLIFSITASISKKVMLASNACSAPFIYNASISVSMLPIIAYRLSRQKTSFARIPDSIILYVILGSSLAASSIFFFKAVSLANVAYAVAIKRLSLVLSVLYGWIFFKERDIHLRLASTLCMFIGIVLVLIG